MAGAFGGKSRPRSRHPHLFVITIAHFRRVCAKVAEIFSNDVDWMIFWILSGALCSWLGISIGILCSWGLVKRC